MHRPYLTNIYTLMVSMEFFFNIYALLNSGFFRSTLSSLHIMVRWSMYFHLFGISCPDASCILARNLLMKGYDGNLTSGHKSFPWKAIHPVGDSTLSRTPRLRIIIWIEKIISCIYLSLSWSCGFRALDSTFAFQLLVQLMGSLIPFFHEFFFHDMKTNIRVWGTLNLIVEVF